MVDAGKGDRKGGRFVLRLRQVQVRRDLGMMEDGCAGKAGSCLFCGCFYSSVGASSCVTRNRALTTTECMCMHTRAHRCLSCPASLPSPASPQAAFSSTQTPSTACQNLLWCWGKPLLAALPLRPLSLLPQPLPQQQGQVLHPTEVSCGHNGFVI
jgi:hypothetical protein